MMVQLSAEESLLWVCRLLAGSGHMPQSDLLDVLRAWERQANYQPPAQSVDEMRAVMQALATANKEQPLKGAS